MEGRRGHEMEMKATAILLGSSPGGSWRDKVKLALWRATRTFLQGLAASFGTGAVGSAYLDTGYWEAVAVSIGGALITAVVSFLQNVASFLPTDPTQKEPTPTPAT
jgi:hypothetical protein